MYYESRLLSHKIKTATIALFIIILLVIARLIHLQIILQQNLYHKSQKNFLRVETISPLRGNILDRNNQLLATNRPTTNLFWQGTGNAKLTTDQINTLQIIQTSIGKSFLTDSHSFDNLKYAERHYQKLLISNDLSFEQLSQIAEQLPEQKNICLTTHFKRFYPYKSFASHLLGYLTRIDMDMHGKMGLEKMYETMLQGIHGQKLKTINSVGKNLSEIETKKALAGQNIQATLDIELQKIVENVFPENFTGTFIIMDPAEGDILALLSRPNFDPALFLKPLQEEDWRSLQEKQPFLNRAFNACYPPGSIFKLVSISALLENNYITTESCWNCRGFTEFAGRQYWCNNRTGHGLINAEHALIYSCNIPFFELGKKINIDVLADYAHRYGLGKKTNIIFAEKEGLIPTSAWKKKIKHEKWWPGETLSVAIGQSYLLATPIQIACMISSIFTGDLVTPRILVDEPITKQPLAISEQTRKFLQQSMQKVVNQGTGQRVKQIKEIKIYAKTSTAQTSSLDKHDLGVEYLEHGWFVCYFSYKDQKPLTVVILVEHAGSARVATEIAKNFLAQYKKMIDRQNLII